MAVSPQAYGIVSQVTNAIYDEQKKSTEKSNTVVTAIGAVLTSLIAGLTYLIESEVAWLPEWATVLVTVLGFAATVFGVSRTKNGITKSIVERIHDGIADLIDAQQRDSGGRGFPEPVEPVVRDDAAGASGERPDAAGGASASSSLDGSVEMVADRLEALAQRLAERRS